MNLNEQRIVIHPYNEEGERGRIGGGPNGGVYGETETNAPSVNCTGFDGQCIPKVLIASGTAAVGGELYAQWSGAGRLEGQTSTIDGALLYYKAIIKTGTVSQTVLDWTQGTRSLRVTGVASGTHTLIVRVAYIPSDGAVVVGQDSQSFSDADAAHPYHLFHSYDSRGREIEVTKVSLSDGTKTSLRLFDYEAASSALVAAGCAQARSCGKLVSAVAKRSGAGDVVQSFTFRASDGRMVGQKLTAPHFNRPINDLAFDYENFGRQNLATYPDGRKVKLIFQSGGVQSVNNFVDGPAPTLTPYATMAQIGDYHADGSLRHFVQGNGVDFFRYIDAAERVQSINYQHGIPPVCGEEGCHPCDPQPGQFCPGSPVWQSGDYSYDGVGNIMQIGDDVFTHDRLNRLMSATLNRHPHLNDSNQLQPAGYVTLNYDFDPYGNITKRKQTDNLSYTAFTDASLEQFGTTPTTLRDYINGPGAPDNKIHAPGFLYDGNGNMVSDGKKDFVYDELNQQVEVREATTACSSALAAGNPHANRGQIQHANPNSGLMAANISCYGMGPKLEENIYGADGMRAVRIVPNTAIPGTSKQTVFVRLGGNVVKEYTEEPNPLYANAIQDSHEKAYIYGPLGLLATEELCTFHCDANSHDVEGAPTTRYYEYDHLGTIRAITTGNGSLESTFDYEPFGLELKGTTPSWTDSSSNTHRFTGHERDDEAGEDYMKARMYVLSTARFPQIDPQFGGAGGPQNWNAYIYVGNSPVGASDPTGMVTNHEHGDLGHIVGDMGAALIAAASIFNPLTASGPSYSAGGADNPNSTVINTAGETVSTCTVPSSADKINFFIGYDLRAEKRDDRSWDDKDNDGLQGPGEKTIEKGIDFNVVAARVIIHSNGEIKVNIFSGAAFTGEAYRNSLLDPSAISIYIDHFRVTGVIGGEMKFPAPGSIGWAGLSYFDTSRQIWKNDPVVMINNPAALILGCHSSDFVAGMSFSTTRSGGSVLYSMNSNRDGRTSVNYMAHLGEAFALGYALGGMNGFGGALERTSATTSSIAVDYMDKLSGQQINQK